ncbi:MAG TPA: ABC transporter substrate-binding protein [Crenalkalicoccus sp.]|nr:ABC transporter substrate-binding protein [Crenalkalicoccus sp.]
MQPNTTRRAVLAAALVAPAIARAETAIPVTLQMNWFGSGDHAPLFLAKRAGLYAAEGLDVTIQRGTGSADAARRVELKQAEFGIADAPTTIAAVAKGANIVMLAVIFDKAANNAFFRRSRGFQGAKDFAGRKVAVAPADSHRVVWPAFARSQGLEPGAITFVNVRPEGKQAIVASGDVDLAFDLYSGYPLWEKALGKDDVGHLLWADAGFNLYGLCYVAHRDTVREKPGLCRRFLAATHRGWAATARDPKAAVDAMVAESGAGLDGPTLLATMPYVLELCVTERSRENGLGWMLPELMQATLDITASGGTLEKVPPLEGLYTNAFNSRIRPAT